MWQSGSCGSAVLSLSNGKPGIGKTAGKRWMRRPISGCSNLDGEKCLMAMCRACRDVAYVRDRKHTWKLPIWIVYLLRIALLHWKNYLPVPCPFSIIGRSEKVPSPSMSRMRTFPGRLQLTHWRKNIRDRADRLNCGSIFPSSLQDGLPPITQRIFRASRCLHRECSHTRNPDRQRQYLAHPL